MNDVLTNARNLVLSWRGYSINLAEWADVEHASYDYTTENARLVVSFEMTRRDGEVTIAIDDVQGDTIVPDLPATSMIDGRRYLKTVGLMTPKDLSAALFCVIIWAEWLANPRATP